LEQSDRCFAATVPHDCDQPPRPGLIRELVMRMELISLTGAALSTFGLSDLGCFVIPVSLYE
jgi:hypothetical protein